MSRLFGVGAMSMVFGVLTFAAGCFQRVLKEEAEAGGKPTPRAPHGAWQKYHRRVALGLSSRIFVGAGVFFFGLGVLTLIDGLVRLFWR